MRLVVSWASNGCLEFKKCRPEKKKKKEVNTKCNTSFSRKIHILNGSEPGKEGSLKVSQSLLSYFLNYF